MGFTCISQSVGVSRDTIEVRTNGLNEFVIPEELAEIPDQYDATADQQGTLVEL